MAKTMTRDTFGRERELAGTIVPRIESELPGVDVLAVELLSPHRFCVYVDQPGGVDFALCEQVTRLLDDFRADWTIDVSSPGPERPLRKPGHFASVVGQRVQVRTAGKTRFRGVVVATDDTAVTIEVDGNRHRIPVEDIVRGNLIDEGR